VEHVRELQEYGPEPLGKEFAKEVFKEALRRRRKAPIKQVLMDAKVVAGIGNIYSDEILFHAKVKPMRLIGSLSVKEVQVIYKHIPLVLKEAIKHKGSSVGDFIRTDGKWGTMGKHHFVYGRAKQPCKVCGTMIQSLKLGGRTGSFCPKCQK
jgi:formamidopyrimidine-DNA glycosylase